ncbi:hypothetical protein ACODT5_03860 [Streptomyces sp. 5.8]|uniref:hypothetical protein n=1 Tax=Streptomyces sp. 5.8 TaxID=3406571 RepID=UPI003BB5A7B7
MAGWEDFEVVRRAAAGESMAPTAWAGHAVMAVAQSVLVPVSAERMDVLRGGGGAVEAGPHRRLTGRGRWLGDATLEVVGA